MRKYLILLLIVSIHLFALNITVFWPAQEFRVFPYLTSSGLLPYKEIIDQHFPGLFFFPINIYTLGLATPVGLRLTHFSLIILTHLLLFLISKKQFNKKDIIAPNILYLMTQIPYEGYVLWIDSFLPPLILISYLLILDNLKKTNNFKIFLSGIFIALAVVVKQSIFLLFIALAVVVFLNKKLRKQIFFLTAGFVIPIIFTLYYFYAIGVWNEFIFWTFTFNWNVYPVYSFRSPNLKEIVYYSIILIPTFASLIYLITKKDVKKQFIILFILPLLILVYGRNDFVHIQPLLPFSTLAVYELFINFKLKKHKLLFILYTFLLLGLTIFTISKLGKSDTFAADKNIKLINYILKIREDKKNIYILDQMPELYQLTNTKPNINLFYFKQPWYTDLMEDEQLKLLKMNKADYIIRSNSNMSKNEAKTLEYINNNYLEINEINGIEIMKIKNNN